MGYAEKTEFNAGRARLAPTVTQTDPAKIVFFDREVYGLKQSVFDCERIIATVTREQCAASYLRNNIGSSCHRCPIGSHFSSGAPVAENAHTAINDSLGFACVRCERTGLTAARIIGRFRLTRMHTLCVSCLNRELEIVKGSNSKGAPPKKWAHLRPATITIENAAGEWLTIDAGLRSGRPECERWVARIYPGCTIVECVFDGVFQPVEPKTTLAGQARAVGVNVGTARARMRRTDAIEPPALSRQTAAYRLKSHGTTAKPADKRGRPLTREETMSDFGFGSKRERVQRDLVAWLSEGWPAFNSKPAAKVADFGFGEEDWSVPLHKIGKPVESDESDADGNGLARRNGWLPPASEEDDAAYRASFDEPAESEWQPSAADCKVLFERPAPLSHAAALPEAVEPHSEPVDEPEEDVVERVEPVEPRAVVGYSDRDPSAWLNAVMGRALDAPKGCDSELTLATGCAITGDYVPAQADEDVADTDTSEPVIEPVASAPVKPQKALTGKQLRKLEKAQRRAKRGQPAPERPTIGKSPRAIAVTARAIVQVAFELNGFKA